MSANEEQSKLSVPEVFHGEVPEDFRHEVIEKFRLEQRSRAARFINRLMFKPVADADFIVRSLYRQALAEKAEEEIRRDAELDRYDDITGLLKGIYFRRNANEALARLDRSDRRLLMPNNAVIVSYDGKGIKKINDTLGHEAGNTVIKNIGEIVQKVARKADIVGRVGDSSDEFAGVYFFRESNILSSEEMEANVNVQIMKHAQDAVEAGEIAGLRWRSTIFVPGLDIRQHLDIADPIPGSIGLMEYPSADVLPSRS
jgi:diguanylate cyclase (GGDEF)-like protein